MANYEQGMIQEVYYQLGRFKHDHGKKRYVRAPFVLIRFQPVNDDPWQDYFMPAPFGGSPNSTEGPLKDYLGSDTGDGDGSFRVGLGYLTRQDIVMEQSELGNWSDVKANKPEVDDRWTMFHRIGFI